MILAIGVAAGVAVAIAAVTAAIIAGTIAIAAWGIGLADSTRNAAIATEAAEALHPELVGLRDTFASVSDETGASSAELRELAARLDEAKVSAEDMPAALRAAALKEALGKGGANDFIADLKAGKAAASELSAEVSNKLGPIVAKQMLGLDAQSARLKKNIGEIFGGLDIEPVLGGLQTLVGFFDKSSASGQALQLVFESVFQPLIDQAQNAAYVVEAFALGFLIGVTKIYIAVKPAIQAVSEFLGFQDSSLSDTLDIAKQAGELIVPVVLSFVGALAAVAAAIGVVIAISVAWTAAIYGAIAAVVYFSISLVTGIIDAFVSVKTFLSEIDLAETGANILQGLADGITGAAGAVVSAITGAVGDGITAAKNLLGIASPSKVFAEIGGYTGEGLVQGVEGATSDVQDAFAAMVEPPDVPASALDAQDTPWGASTFGAGGGSQQVSDVGPSSEVKSNGGGRILDGATLNFYGVKDAENARDLFEEMLTKVLEGNAASISGAPA
jgi:hypothetical protein